MRFCFYPGHEAACPNVGHCPHLGGAALGTLVLQANTAGDTIDRLYRQLNSERERNSALVDANQKLEQQLAQAKLELKLERQNKYAPREQADEEEGSDDNSGDGDPPAEEPAKKKRGAPVGHPGWYRPTPTEFDWSVDVPAPSRCPHCSGHVTAHPSLDAVDHLQEDIIDNIYRVVCYQHEAALCDDCRRSAQQPGDGELLGSRIGPFLRSRALWLRHVIGISYRKIPQIIQEMHGITFTPAALIGFETLLAEKSKPVADDIEKKLASSDGAVHADETYWTTNGARSYFWVHADANFVLFRYDTSRAGQVSRDILGDDFSGTLVTDCYAGYNASAAGAKQKCLAHLARTARDWQKLLTEADAIDFQFFDDIKQFSKHACEFCRLRGAGRLSIEQQTIEIAWLREEISRLETCEVEHEKAITLQARLLRHRGEWLIFIDDPRVPPTNNEAERTLRPLVVLRKITFGSRTDEGAKRMATLMSVAETARRRGHRASKIYYELFTRPPNKVLQHLYAKP